MAAAGHHHHGGAAAASSASEALASPREAKEPTARQAADKGVAASDDLPRFYTAKWGWSPSAPGELNLAKGDTVYVTSRTAEWWKGRTPADQSGWFPADRVRPITDPAKLAETKSVYKRLAKQKEGRQARRWQQRQKRQGEQRAAARARQGRRGDRRPVRSRQRLQTQVATR